jgi:predicted alpha/beta hydrolase family esterase
VRAKTKQWVGEVGLRILFIHAAGAQDTDDSSQPLLRGLRKALGRRAAIDAPIMPDPDNPDAGAWGRAVRKHLKAMDEDFVAVGHSLGASTILKELAEHGVPRKLRGVVTMAMPYWPDWGIKDYALSKDVSRLKTLPLILYISTDDETVGVGHLDRYRKLLPHAVLKRISGTGHLFDKAPFAEIAADIASLAADGR